MDLQIPDGQLVDTPPLELLDDPATVFAAHSQAAAYNYLAAPLGAESEEPEIRVRIDGGVKLGGVEVLNVGPPTLVIDLTYKNHAALLIVRKGAPREPWELSTKMLMLPADTPDSWGSEDAASDQRNGRVLLFVGWVTLNRWFAQPR